MPPVQCRESIRCTDCDLKTVWGVRQGQAGQGTSLYVLDLLSWGSEGSQRERNTLPVFVRGRKKKERETDRQSVSDLLP